MLYTECRQIFHTTVCLIRLPPSSMGVLLNDLQILGLVRNPRDRVMFDPGPEKASQTFKPGPWRPSLNAACTIAPCCEAWRKSHCLQNCRKKKKKKRLLSIERGLKRREQYILHPADFSLWKCWRSTYCFEREKINTQRREEKESMLHYWLTDSHLLKILSTYRNKIFQ